jgi:tetratricopeptide (TPR) repeat protein
MATMVEATTRGQTTAATSKPAPWYRDRSRLLAGAGVVVLLLAAVGWVIWSSDRRKEEFAARSLNQARAAAEAVITLNQVRMVNGQSELAAVGLREFIQRNPPAKYLAPAYGLLGTALENSKRPGDAGEAFRNASKSAGLEYLRARYLIDAGRAYKAGGKQAEAVAAYRAVIDSFPESPSVTEAKVRLAEMTDGKM